MSLNLVIVALLGVFTVIYVSIVVGWWLISNPQRRKKQQQNKCLSYIYDMQIRRILIKEDIHWLANLRCDCFLPIDKSEIELVEKQLRWGIELIDERFKEVSEIDIFQGDPAVMEIANKVVNTLDISWQLPPEVIASCEVIKGLRLTQQTNQVNLRLN